MTTDELSFLSNTCNHQNSTDILNRIWNAYDRGRLNIRLSAVGNLLNKLNEYIPDNHIIQDLENEHKYAR
jgi:hypothetical protein